MTFAAALTEDRRLVILRVLHEMPAYQSNSSILYTLIANWGHNPTRDQLKTDLRWLNEVGLVVTRDLSDGAVLLANLTERGQDVATGRAIVPGVKRPGA